MLSLTISLIIAVAIGGACMAAGLKGGAIALGVLGFFVSQFLIGFLVRKKMKSVNAELQDMMAAAQKRIQIKVNQFQMKPGGNPTALQRQIEKDQQEIFKKGLEFTEKLKPFRKWNPLMDKQISTLRMQFLYQLKEFEQVDEVLSKGIFTGPVFSDIMLVAMKMARQYKQDDIKGAEKTFKRYARWYRNDKGALLYGVMSWIYVQKDRAEDARKLLAKAKEKMFHETLVHNWEMLTNNRVKAFSNAGFGDQWYGLYLENIPAPKQQRIRPKKGRRPF